MSDVVSMYESVSVHEVERILEFMKQAWLHGFPMVRKEDGRSERQLRVQAAMLLLVATGCMSREQEVDADILSCIKQDMERGGRLAHDAMDLLELVRSPDRYTRQSVELRRQQKDKAL